MSDFDLELVPQVTPTLYFFGVTTARSSSRRMFPAWAEILGLGDARLVGLDFPINAPPEHYRCAVEHIKRDALSLGALVTTHKLNVLRAARDLFDDLSDEAAICGEVSCIYKREGRLIAHAVDPLTSGLAMRRFIEPGYWQKTGAAILCLGAGGSAAAIASHFMRTAAPEDQPQRMVFVNRGRPNLDHLQAIIARMPVSRIACEYLQNDNPTENDRLMGTLPPGSMVINATGMGKDTPGSPLTDAGVFPENGIAWDLNYRGELDFLRQARAQAESRRLHVEDGWNLFLLGWSHVVGSVFNVEITPALFAELSRAAEIIR